MIRLSPHFTLAELTTTSTGLPNQPSAADRVRLVELCSHVLEPWRAVVGPLRVTSGYRAWRVNAAVGGSITSQHMRGEAADVVPLTVPLADAWHRLLELVAGGLPVDQAIVYQRPAGQGWVHVSYTSARAVRRELLVQPQGIRGYVAWSGWSGPLVTG